MEIEYRTPKNILRYKSPVYLYISEKLTEAADGRDEDKNVPGFSPSALFDPSPSAAVRSPSTFHNE